MKKVFLTLLLLPLFASAAEAGDGSRRLYETGNNAEVGCLAGGAVGVVVSGANAISERKLSSKLFLAPVFGCTAGGIAFGMTDAAMAEEAPKDVDLNQEDPPAPVQSDNE